MHHITDDIWLGTEASLSTANNFFAMLYAGEAQKAFGSTYGEPDAPEVPHLLTVQDGVAVVKVRGPLVNTDSPYTRYYGITSYNDIREALVHAAQDAEIGAILLDVGSPGGQVSGVSDTAALIAQIDAKHKPVVAYTDSAMCSAAYWLGCSGRMVFSSELAMVGSIGVLAVHMETSKYDAAEGVTKTVVRSGEFKALANSHEPLTDKARAQIQKQLDTTYQVFISHVATFRNLPVGTADAQVGQGREFLGREAATLGLTDGVSGYDAVFLKASGMIPTTSNLTFLPNRSNQGMKTALTDATPVEAVVATPAAVEASAPVQAEAQDTGITAFLRQELSASQGEVVSLKVALAQAEGKLATAGEAHSKLVAIATEGLGRMRVALGRSAEVGGLSVEALLTEHAQASSDFAKTFPVGGVSAPVVGKEAETFVPDFKYQQRLAATRFNK